jgi:hypothetical protein
MAHQPQRIRIAALSGSLPTVPSTDLDFEQLQDALRALGLDAKAAEFHGASCGYVCAGGHDAEAFLRAYGDEQWPTPDAAQRSALDSLRAAFATSRRLLDDEDLGFDPLLPGESAHVHERAQALVDWCQGFLSGLGLGGMTAHQARHQDVREILRDMSTIAASELGFDRDEEVDESALSEILEWIRVSVLLVREDLAHARARAAAPSGTRH